MTDLKNSSPRSKVREITEEYTKRRRIVYEDSENAESSSACSSGVATTADAANDPGPVPASQGAAAVESTASQRSSSSSSNKPSNQVTAAAPVASASKPPPAIPEQPGNDGGSPPSDLTPAANRYVSSPGSAAASATADAAITSVATASLDRRATENPVKPVGARTSSRASLQPPDGTTSVDANERRPGQKGQAVSKAAEERLSQGGGALKPDSDPQSASAGLQPTRKFDYFVIPLANDAALPTISVREEARVGPAKTQSGTARRIATAARGAESDAAAAHLGRSNGGGGGSSGKGPDRTDAGSRSQENRGAGLPADSDSNSVGTPSHARSGRRLCEQYSNRELPPVPRPLVADSGFFDRPSAGREKGRDRTPPPTPPPPPPSPAARQPQPEQPGPPRHTSAGKSSPQRCADAESRSPPPSGRRPFDPQPVRIRRPVVDADAPPRTRRHDFESSSVFAPAGARRGRSAAYDDSDEGRSDCAGDEDFFATWSRRSPAARNGQSSAAAADTFDGFDGSTPRSWRARSGTPTRVAWADDPSGGGGGQRSERRIAAAADGSVIGSRDRPPFWTESPFLGLQQGCTTTTQYYCVPPTSDDRRPVRTRSDYWAGERDLGEAGGGFTSWDRSGYNFFTDPPPAAASAIPLRLCRSSSLFELDPTASRCGGLWPPPRAWEDAFYFETQEAARSSIIKRVSRRLA